MIKCQVFPTLKSIQNETPNLKAIFFDMDGTLLKSEFVHAFALQKLLLTYNDSSPSSETLEKQYIGIADRDVICEMQDLGLLPHSESVDILIDKKNKFFISSLMHFNQDDYIMPEIINTLTQAKIQNIKLALVTASESEATHAILNHLNLSSFFDLIITAGDCKHTKPHPEPYLNALKELSLDAKDVVILEDSLTGLESATRTAPAAIYKAEWYLQ